MATKTLIAKEKKVISYRPTKEQKVFINKVARENKIDDLPAFMSLSLRLMKSVAETYNPNLEVFIKSN